MKSILSFLFILICSISGFAANFIVTRSDDRNATCMFDDCSLREAVAAANNLASDDVINFADNITLITLTDQIGIVNAGTLVIAGRGANIFTIDGGAGTNRIFVLGNATVTVSGATLTGGNGGGSSFFRLGGAIYAENSSLTLDSVYITGNSGSDGGGVSYRMGGVSRIINSTFSNNTATGTGGAIEKVTVNLTIVNSTFSGNTAASGGGAIHNAGGEMTLRSVTITNNSSGINHLPGNLNIGNTIIAGNTHEISAQHMITSNGFNLIGDSAGDSANTGFPISYQSTDIRDTPPQLGILKNNGGTTPTHALERGSPAIDKGSNALAVNPENNLPLTFDQRGSGFARIKNGYTNSAPIVDIGAFEVQTAFIRKNSFDFDGDSKSDVSVFRPSTGYWYRLNSSNNSFYAIQFGASNDLIAPADYDGDGKTDIAVWRGVVPGAGDKAYFYILSSTNNTFIPVQFGTQGDLPIVGDWDGDGKADLAVYRGSGQSNFYYRPSSTSGIDYRNITFGIPGDKPLVGDFDGDGKTDAAVFRASEANWLIWRSSDNQIARTTFGESTDIPVPADYDGDGVANIAVFRPSNGTWYTSQNPAINFGAIQFGANGDLPVPADYDGDGRADAAVFRPSNGAWYLNRTTSGFAGVQFGMNGDKPIPNAYIR